MWMKNSLVPDQLVCLGQNACILLKNKRTPIVQTRTFFSSTLGDLNQFTWGDSSGDFFSLEEHFYNEYASLSDKNIKKKR